MEWLGITAALERSPEKYADVLPVVRDLRDTLERLLALRRTELSQWRRKLSELATERCGLAEAETGMCRLGPRHRWPYPQRDIVVVAMILSLKC